jgi:hypothetical protein
MMLPPSKTHEAKLIDTNLKNAFFAMSSVQKSQGNSQYVFSNIPHPVFNCVLHAEASENEAEKLIQIISADYKKNNIPHCWWLTECSTPQSLAKLLKNLGFIKGPSYCGLHVHTKKIKLESTEYPTIRIEQIKSIEEIDHWVTPIQESFEFSKEVTEGFVNCFKNLLNKDKRFIHFVAYYNDSLAGSATLFLDQESAGLYNGAVFPSFRRKGIMGCLGKHMVLEAINRGLKDIIVQTASTSYNLAIKAGFKTYLNYHAYLSPS